MWLENVVTSFSSATQLSSRMGASYVAGEGYYRGGTRPDAASMALSLELRIDMTTWASNHTNVLLKRSDWVSYIHTQ